MHRFYADPDLSDDKCFVLTQEDTVHALKVLRMHTGDRAEVISGGNRFLAEIGSAVSERTELHPIELLPSTEPHLSVTLF